MPPTLVGIVIGYFLMDRIPESEFGPLIGWIIIALIGVQFLRSYLGAKVDHIFESHSFGAGMGTKIAAVAAPTITPKRN